MGKLGATVPGDGLALWQNGKVPKAQQIQQRSKGKASALSSDCGCWEETGPCFFLHKAVKTP